MHREREREREREKESERERERDVMLYFLVNVRHDLRKGK